MTRDKFMRLLFLIGAAFTILVVAISVYVFQKNSKLQSAGSDMPVAVQETIPPQQESQPSESDVAPLQQPKQTLDPIADALSRITKKPFGIYITPKTSPVQPERFSGYHNAVDLETFSDEQNIDVPVRALCDGKLLMARFASGYGGVAVESCTLDGQAVTIIYGHVRLSSVAAKVGSQLKAGDFLANLGTGFSGQTDGERKHLHLGIHKGSGINILGYVQSKSQLSGWIDPARYLQ